MAKYRKIVFHSIDSPRRELEWRLFIAVKLAERGFTNIIGSKTEIEYLHECSKNCFFLGRLNSVTGRFSSDFQYLKRMEENGTKLFYLHDEGGFYFRGEYNHAVRKIYPEELFGSQAFEKVFFWGEGQKSVFKNSPEQSKFIVSGSPRFDLLKPKFSHVDSESVQNLREKYGQFVLVCTRFGAVNRVPDEPTTLSKRSYDIRVEGGALERFNERQVLETMFGAWEKISYEFTSFIPALAKLVQDFPSVNFIVRPHPAERQSFYTDSFSHFKNVIIDKSGDVRPFIRAASVVIHSECTTGLEAEIAGKATINFRPCMNSEGYSQFFVEGVSEIGVQCADYDSLNEALSEALSGKTNVKSSLRDASSYLVNAESDRFSYEQVVRVISESSKRASSSSVFPVFKIRSFLQLKRFLKNRLRALRDKMVTVGLQTKGDSKFYRFDDKDLVRFVEKLGSKNIKIKRRGANIWISPK